MSVIRVQHRSNYFPISRALAQDKSIGFDVRGLMLYLLSKPDGWEGRPSDVEQEGGIGREARRGLMKRAEIAGYLVFRQERDDQGHPKSWYDAYEEPVSSEQRTRSWETGGRGPEKGSRQGQNDAKGRGTLKKEDAPPTEKPYPVGSADSGSPGTGHPPSGFPATGNPLGGFPVAGEPPPGQPVPHVKHEGDITEGEKTERERTETTTGSSSGVTTAADPSSPPSLAPTELRAEMRQVIVRAYQIDRRDTISAQMEALLNTDLDELIKRDLTSAALDAYLKTRRKPSSLGYIHVDYDKAILAGAPVKAAPPSPPTRAAPLGASDDATARLEARRELDGYAEEHAGSWASALAPWVRQAQAKPPHARTIWDEEVIAAEQRLAARAEAA